MANGRADAHVPPVLSALVDTFLPAVARGADGGPRYPSASSIEVDRDVAELVAGLPDRLRDEFRGLLTALESPLTNLILTGRPQRFTRLEPAAREAYLLAWSRSRLVVKRKGFQAAKRLATWLYFSAPTSGADHPLWTRLHYRPPALPVGIPDPFLGLASQVLDRDTDESVDVCVVGSGAGGSVVAARLASAGYRVAVLEAGGWFPRAAYPRIEREAFDQLLVGRGIVTTRDSAIAFLAGETAGGGTSLNWMTCLPPLPEARTEWAREGGMAGADGRRLDDALGHVADRMRVSTVESEVNPSNDALRRGCRALGYAEGSDWGIIPRNAVGCANRCGFCAFGCPYGGRQSTVTTFLADAMAHGARLYCSTRVERIEIAQGRVRGVWATQRNGNRPRSVHVRARAVVVAAGALQTPALLLRSDVRGGGVGRGLRIDPTTALVGEFPDPVRTWEGPPQTVGVYRFQRSDEGAHGPWIEVAPAHPGLAALAVPWQGSADYRRLLERTEFVATPITLVRDVGEGRVTVDGAGRPVVDYTLTERDRRNLTRGLVEMARLLKAAGATRLLSLHTPYLEVGNGENPVTAGELERFLEGLRRAGVREHSLALFSAHPMGSARAGLDPRRSAAGPSGEVHGVEGLWIGDGSLLPSAPGANPMLSILALAWLTAGQLLSRLAGASEVPPRAG